MCCMGSACSESVLEDASVVDLLDAKHRKIYLSQLIDSFCANNANVCFCPSTQGCPGIACLFCLFVCLFVVVVVVVVFFFFLFFLFKKNLC